jgi:hypothetical protein
VRIRFADPNNPHEQAARAKLTQQIDGWWDTFSAYEEKIRALFARKARLDLAELMKKHLQNISPHLAWEFGPAVRGPGNRLVITPEGHRHLQPLRNEILRTAPALPTWEFYPARVPEPLPEAAHTVEARTHQSIIGWKVLASPNDRGGVDLDYVTDGKLDNDEAWQGAFVATEALLGEDPMEIYVDEITVDGAPQGTPRGLDTLPQQFEAALRQARSRLPDRPLFESIAERTWAMVEVEPESGDDFAGTLDLVQAHTACLPMFERAHGTTFDSARFSRCGETFCYVKFEDLSDSRKERLRVRTVAEKALRNALEPARLGAVVGAGTGLRHGYLHLALPSVEAAVPVVQETLRGLELSRRTWVQFFDDALADEWIGLWDDSPAPPGCEG